jgi:hypothetical protein
MAIHRIGVALGIDEAVVVAAGLERALTVPASLPPLSEDPTNALVQVFARIQAMLVEQKEIAEDAASSRVRVRVALLPPLSDVRLVSLPPLKADELAAVLRRDASRHFLGSGRPLIVAGERVGERGSDHLAPVLAGAAPRVLVESLQRAVEAVGWELERIVPAHAAWLRALDKAAPAPAESAGGDAPASGVRAVIAVLGNTVHVVHATGGVPDQIRRVPLAPGAVVEAVGKDPGRALLLADEPDRGPLSDALSDAGWVTLKSPDRSARVAAALHGGDSAPELIPTPLAMARQEQSRRTTVRMVGAAIVVLALAASVNLLGQVREYKAVRRERAELREVVAPAMAARDSLNAINERLDELRTLGDEAARWTFSLVEMSVLLPDETHLVSLRAAGDTAVVEAEGGRAGDALSALRTATTLEDVRVEGSIQREIEDGTAAGERFTLSAVLKPRKKTSATAEKPPQADSTVGGGAP